MSQGQHDVAVVGAGATGVLVAEQLARAGLSVIILEAGPRPERRLPGCDRAGFERAVAPLLQVDEDAWRYQARGLPFVWSRVRAAGGRTLAWGGWCARLDAQNLSDARAFGAPWPFAAADLDYHYQAVETLLALREAPVDPCFEAITRKLGLPVRPKLAAVGPCGCRAWVSLDSLKRARLQSNAVALRVLLGPSGRAEGIEYLDANTRKVEAARARRVVLCASPIETARLLLMTARGGPAGAHGLVGRGLTEHLVASDLVIVPEPAPAPGLAGPLERAAWVPRFVNLGRKRRRDYRGGFTVEVRGPTALDTLGVEALRILEVDPLEAPALSYFQVHAIGESAPNPRRFVELDPTATDQFDRPIPVVNFEWGEDEPKMARDMDEAAAAIADALCGPGSRIIPVRSALTPGGVGHEAGTCAMGRDPKRSVTDLSGAVRGVPGLFVADAALMPTGLDRYPTLTVLALALSVAAGIVETAARGD